MENKIAQFKSDLSFVDDQKHKIVLNLEALFLSSNEVTEKFIYGGIGMYIEDELIGGIWVSKNHVSLVFGNGFRLEDKYHQLEGIGKYRRHIKVRSLDDIEQKHCAEYIDNLIALEKNGPFQK